MSNKKSQLNFIVNLRKLGRKTVDESETVLNRQIKSLDQNIFEPEEDEIINGLFFRIFRFFRTFILDYHLLADDIAQIILRTMMESYIYLAYLLQENKHELFLEFKKYGIGQDKLYKLHLIRLLEEGKIKKTKELINFIESQSDDEIWDEMISIKLKSFDDLRKIAEKVGLRDKYALEYQPYSVVSHGQWPALRRYYLQRCKNPLHRFHFIPRMELPPLNLKLLGDVMSLLDQSYKLWIKRYKLKNELKPVLKEYTQETIKLLKKERKPKRKIKKKVK